MSNTNVLVILIDLIVCATILWFVSGFYTRVKLVKVRRNAIRPKKASHYSAGRDLYMAMDDVDSVTIAPGETKLIGTGIKISLPFNTFGAIFARSGLATKQGLRPANCVGVIDSDYTGEVMVALHNDSNEHQKVYNGERIAQLVVIPYVNADFYEVKSLKNTLRGEGGFGSTGVNAKDLSENINRKRKQDGGAWSRMVL